MGKSENFKAPIVGIDILRLAAAFMVMTFHFGFKALSEEGGLFDTYLGMEPHMPQSWLLSWWGWVGVQIFFTISGLIISYSALSSGVTPARFVRGRVLRLVPVVLVASCVAAAVEILVFGRSPLETATLWVRTVLFWPFAPWLMGQFWTLGIEIMFYALVLGLIMSRRTDLLPKVGAALISASAAYWAARFMNEGHDPLGRVTQLLLLQHGAFFGIGMLLSARYRSGPERWHLPAIGAGLCVAMVQISVATAWEAGDAGLRSYWPMAFVIYAASVGACWISMQRNEVLVGWIGRSGAQFVRKLGLMTYPLYLLHNHVGKPVILAVVGLGGSPVVAILLAMVVCVISAWLVATLAEPVLYRLIRRVYDDVGDGLRLRVSKFRRS